MYKLTFTLKQHTPLIHFQHDQEGATLRASEVKPKLDNYLFEILGGKQFVAERKPKWLKNGALDYAMKISTSNLFTYPIEVPKLNRDRTQIERNINGEIKTEIYPCFFGNMGTDASSKNKLFVFTNNPIKITITSKNQSVFDFMSDSEVQILISRFFNKNNFSSRQSKGFGSFSIFSNKDEIYWEESKYFFDVNINQSNINRLRREHNIRFSDINMADEQLIKIDQWRQLFYQINLFHKVLKSGYNQQGGYIKSTLFKYFKEKLGIQWDKKSIKEEYFNNVLINQTNTHNNEDILTYDKTGSRKLSPKNNLFLVRDLLGLTSEADWRGTLYNNAKISKSNEDIERFMSPITYKPIFFSDADGDFFRVFIFLSEIPDEFLGKTFLVQVNGAGNLQLDTPDKNSFSLSSYFSYLSSSNFDIDDLINRENNDTIKIQEMFNCLKLE